MREIELVMVAIVIIVSPLAVEIVLYLFLRIVERLQNA